ncbi:alpha/beta hydrolase [Xiamenia xianingshaonis]|uniref:Alpha/beta hydrolase n=1 Tax=Xiamenia xianingshaonis TaxID=2682776 RepID=A0A9E6SUI7_9ACTN|nr:alpha/beta hydrolase [Xiamenia xianingshaonis]NHM13355.1 alpha/beta hydrolase [Xiamenia xianingshaonis]QTU84565.1 alpha/beta hydrolase [Xiamenia xianingshaonis]
MQLELTPKWDKVFPKNDKVHHKKVVFHNRYGIDLAADLYRPRDCKPDAKLAALAVSGPFGAVKEQASGLYAQEMASRGFLALAFDPSFTGESGGAPRYMASPDINTEDFQAAVDYLSCRSDVDCDRIGIIGICGWGGLALNAAAIDVRVKATIVSTMYDMSRIAAKGYFDAQDSPESRHEARKQFCEDRTRDYRTGAYPRSGGVVDPLPADAPDFVKQYHAYYKTPRGYHPRSLNSNDGWTNIGTMSFLNQPILCWAGEITSAVMVAHGSEAHSLYMGRDAFAQLNGSNKQFVEVAGATHCDLYDNYDFIPFDAMQAFLEENL